jgi:aldose sugar dehydrogenase
VFHRTRGKIASARPRLPRAPRFLATAGAIALLLGGARCGAEPASTAPGCELVESGHGPAGEVPIRVEVVASGLEVPWGLAFLPGGDVLVTERPGRVRLLRDGTLDPEPVLTIPVASEGEGGLLGVAIDPRFEENRRFYLYFTSESGGRSVNRVVRWALAQDGRSAQEERVLLDELPAAVVHNGGRLRFGPDGMLYVGTGDAADRSRSQDLEDPSGKILRVTTEGEPAPGNPFPDSPVLLLGIRNVQAFDWLDAETLVVADHGPSGEMGRRGHDEITVARAGDNLGWPEVFGCEVGLGTPPVLVFRDATPPGGGALYRGDGVPAWRGSFLVGTLGSRHLQRVQLGPDGSLVGHERYLVGDPPAGLGRLREVIEGPDGALWVTTSNCDGRGTCPAEGDLVLRIVADGAAGAAPGGSE